MDSLEICDDLNRVEAAQWNALRGPDTIPFLRHEFLAGLERFGCVGERWGWLPRHLLLRDPSGVLRGALPLYLKYNSYGELVFDWAWAEAYQRAGRAYYPKLVSAVPYTPVSGPRLLLHADAPAATRTRLLESALQLARGLGVSSLHWLFPDSADHAALLQHPELLPRQDCQFHWFNRGYRDFDDFLDRFTAHKRKKLKRERSRVQEAGVELEVLDGHTASEAQWAEFYRFYCSTFERRSGYATLSLEFFQYLGRTLPDQVMLVLARAGSRYVAGAFSLRGANALYGRHWGCDETYHSLHFEACYYLGIEYCIRHGLASFEPGAQGEHKVSRGFEPVLTHSVHWLADPGFRRIVARHLEFERAAVLQRRDELEQHLPFKTPSREH